MVIKLDGTKGIRKKLKHFTVTKMFCSKHSDRFLSSCNILCTLNAL